MSSDLVIEAESLVRGRIDDFVSFLSQSKSPLASDFGEIFHRNPQGHRSNQHIGGRAESFRFDELYV